MFPPVNVKTIDWINFMNHRNGPIKSFMLCAFHACIYVLTPQKSDRNIFSSGLKSSNIIYCEIVCADADILNICTC